ncbi:hypothetical protein VN24_13150 [Paenibacillus beijingensis]|uniref:Uncharacterized protein n=1 Tax=Paenibacillus beijingensis TaxID=1126833 RepID=A0A0D5NR19_9BACL|nr:hypothetical protein VN24_13150 [Paenibacillus beijingensis]
MRGQAFSAFGYDMIMAIYRAGGMPVPLPVVDDEFIGVQIENVDGIVFSGGEDIHPSLYGEVLQSNAHRIDPFRDRYESALMKAALEAGVPMLCVCRGMQLLNVIRGGTLCSDIKDTQEAPLEHWETDEPWKSVHPVHIKEGHYIEGVLGKGKVEVNSIHHQAIDKIGDGLEVVALSPDGIAEALTMKDRDNVLAVQWHPEFIAKKDSQGLKPFSWLMDVSKK